MCEKTVDLDMLFFVLPEGIRNVEKGTDVVSVCVCRGHLVRRWIVWVVVHGVKGKYLWAWAFEEESLSGLHCYWGGKDFSNNGRACAVPELEDFAVRAA